MPGLVPEAIRLNTTRGSQGHGALGHIIKNRDALAKKLKAISTHDICQELFCYESMFSFLGACIFPNQYNKNQHFPTFCNAMSIIECLIEHESQLPGQ